MYRNDAATGAGIRVSGTTHVGDWTYAGVGMCSRARRGAWGCRVRSGFTLIELLVVVAIIAVLIAVLLPGLNSARRMAKGTVCLSNNMQIAQAVVMYAGDYGCLAPLQTTVEPGDDLQTQRVFGNYDLLGPYVSTEQIFVGPENPNPTRVHKYRDSLGGGSGFFKTNCVTSYMSVSNTWFNSSIGMRSPVSAWVHGKLGQVRYPADTISMFEGRGSSVGPFTSGNERLIGFQGDESFYDLLGPQYWGIRYRHGKRLGLPDIRWPDGDGTRMAVSWFDGHATMEPIFQHWRPFVGYE